MEFLRYKIKSQHIHDAQFEKHLSGIALSEPKLSLYCVCCMYCITCQTSVFRGTDDLCESQPPAPNGGTDVFGDVGNAVGVNK